LRTIPVEVPDEALSSVLFGKTRRRLLGWLFMHPDESFYVRQLARIIGASPGAVPRDLKPLTSVGILERTSKGREVFYQVNRSSPIFEELRGIFLKTAGISAELRRALEPLSNRIRVALLHGSAVKGALRAESDIDLIVVGDVAFGDIVSALGPAQGRLGREINPIVYSVEEFREKVGSGHHFLTSVLQGPYTFVAGGENELGRLLPKRLADHTQDVAKRDRRFVRRHRPRPGR
jgi:predicted nucleotidyltransferase